MSQVRIGPSKAIIAGKVVDIPSSVIEVVPSWRPQVIVDGAGNFVGIVRFRKRDVIRHRIWKLWSRLTERA